jgi:hypothetical protein
MEEWGFTVVAVVMGVCIVLLGRALRYVLAGE